MEATTLQSSNYPYLLEKSKSSRNYKELNRLITRTLSDP